MSDHVLSLFSIKSPFTYYWVAVYDLLIQSPGAEQQPSSDLSRVWRDSVPWLWTEASGVGGWRWGGCYICPSIDLNGHFVLSPNVNMNTELHLFTRLACGKGQADLKGSSTLNQSGFTLCSNVSTENTQTECHHKST